MVRGLTFDTGDVNASDSDDINGSPIRQSVCASEATGTSAASATPPRFRRSVSFSAHPQVLELKESSQEIEAGEGQSSEGQVPFDEANLPDGVTAIAVADPNDPSIIVMQVGNIHGKPFCHELVKLCGLRPLLNSTSLQRLLASFMTMPALD